MNFSWKYKQKIVLVIQAANFANVINKYDFFKVGLYGFSIFQTKKVY